MMLTMAKTTTSPRPILSFRQANTIFLEFLPIAEKIFSYMDRLKDAGFATWVPRSKFIESFAANEEELRLHRKCVIEAAKNRLARPWPLSLKPDDTRLLFSSPFLHELKAKRDEENGVPEDQLSKRYGGGAAWRCHEDPCQRRLVYAELNEKEEYERRWNAMLVEGRNCLKLEVAHHSTGLSTNYTFDKRGRYEFFVAVMKHAASPLGFHHDATKSYPDYPVFSKPINEDWDLCWALEEPNTFYWNQLEGRFIPYLEIRNRKLHGSLNKAEAGEFLHIRYAGVVPGFYNGYRTFIGLDELETMIKAHLCFFSLMAPVIESAVHKVLGDS